MVLKILADAIEPVHRGDAELAQQRWRADAGKLQQLRALQRPGAQQHLAPHVRRELLAPEAIDDRVGARAVEREPGRACVGLDAEIGASSRWLEVGVGSAAAPASLRRQMVVARALLHRAVEIVVARDAELAGSGDDRLDELMRAVDRRTPQRPVLAVKRAIAERRVLEASEIRQYVGVAPSDIAGGCPPVVILPLAANGNEAVD